MYEPQLAEYADQIVCVKHSNPISVVSFEEGVQIQDQLLCGQCLSEAIKISPTQIPWNIVKTMIQEQQKKRLSHFQSQLKPMLDNAEDFENTIIQIRQRITQLDQITNTTNIWKKELNNLRKDECKFSLFKELEIMINKDKFYKASFIEEQQIGKIKKCSQQFINQLCIQFQEFSLSKLIKNLQEIIVKVHSCMEQFLVSSKPQLPDGNQKISNIVCICPKHKMPITLINVNKGIKKEGRVICVNCDISNVISIIKFEERWKQYQDSLQKMRNDKLTKLQLDIAQTKKQITQMKSQVMCDCNKIEILLDTQIKQRIALISKKTQGYNNHLEQLQQFAEELSQNEKSKELGEDREFDNISQQHNKHIISQLDKLSKLFNGTVEDVKKASEYKLIGGSKKVEGEQLDDSSRTKTKKQLNQSQQLKPITYKLVNEIQQQQWCWAVAFNNEGTIMAAGYEKQIKIWEIENGTLKSTPNLLSGHTADVLCLVFSKKENWFTSGSSDKTLRCWKETTKNNWVSSQPEMQHSDQVRCLLLNRNEDQLLSCSGDTSIMVWQVNQSNNTLNHYYSLHKHTNDVCCISLNESETTLVSCSQDKSIIIWVKGQLGNWEFKNYITKSIDDYGFRISFVNDNMIAWQQYSKGITHIFELNNGVFKERRDQQVTLFQFGDEDQFQVKHSYQKLQMKMIFKIS